MTSPAEPVLPNRSRAPELDSDGIARLVERLRGWDPDRL